MFGEDPNVKYKDDVLWKNRQTDTFVYDGKESYTVRTTYQNGEPVSVRKVHKLFGIF